MCSILSLRHHFIIKPICLWIFLMDVTLGNHQANFNPNFQMTFVFYELLWLLSVCIYPVCIRHRLNFLEAERDLNPPCPCFAHAMKYPCKTWSNPWPLVKCMLQNHYSETLFAWCHWHIQCCCNWQDLGVNHGFSTWLWQLFPVQSLVQAWQTLLYQVR